MSMGFTEVEATRQELIASIVQETLKQKSLLLPTITDYSSFATPGNKSISIPRRDQLAAEDKVENTDLTAQLMTFSVDKIDLNLHKAIYVELERSAELQSMPNVQAEVIKEMAAELALQIDKDIYAQLQLPDAGHRIQFANTPTNTVGLTDILNGRRLLNLANVSDMPGERFLLVNPVQEAALLTIENFIHAEKYMSNAPIMTAEIGKVYNFTVLMSNVAADDEVVMYHKSAIGIGMQLQPTFDTDKNLKNIADEFLLNQLYGVKAMQAGLAHVIVNDDGL